MSRLLVPARGATRPACRRLLANLFRLIAAAPVPVAALTARTEVSARVRSPIELLFSRLLAVFVLSAVAVLASASTSTVQATPLACVENNKSCLEAADSSALGQGQIPLILIHGWHEDQSVWQAFENYFATSGLGLKYKLYRYYYASDLVSLRQLGQDFRDVLDIVNTSDPQNFGSKQIAIISHSMGGLIGRDFLSETQSAGTFAGQSGGERILKLITLATPHYGAPVSNGKAAENKSYLFSRFAPSVQKWTQGIDYRSHNLSDLHWDNNFDQEHALDYQDFPGEQNPTLIAMNMLTTYDNKIVAYGSFIDDTNCNAESLLLNDVLSCLAFVNRQAFNFLSDGVVPYESALFQNSSHPAVLHHSFFGYNHYEIVSSNNVFSYIKKDLTIDTSVAKSDLLPTNLALSSTTLSPGQNLTINWSLTNQGPAAANAASTTVVRINQSATSAGPLLDLASVPTRALAAGDSQPQSVTLHAPITQGTYYVWVIADNNSDVTNQGPNTGNDLVHSIPFSVPATAVSLTVNGINTSYSTTTTPFQPTINLTGSGFSSVQQVSWTCAMPNGTSCGAIKSWTPSNWTNKFTATSDNAANISPVLLVPGDPVGTYQWTVTLATATQSISKSFSVSFTSQGTYSTSTGLVAAPNLSTSGQPVTFTASVISSGGTPTGTVQFNEGGTTLSTGTLSNGTAIFTKADLSVGTHTVTAAYSGATGFSQSTSNGATVTVQSPSTALIVTPSSGSVSGQYGGPFTSLGFQVSTTSGSTNFTIAQTPYWLDASITGGIAGPTSTNVNFTVNANGNGLSPGVYTGEIFFSINGGGVGSVFRTVNLTVTAPPAGVLQVSQGDILVSGPQLGPFLPDTFIYQLSATSGSVGYTISNWPSWLTPLSTTGTVGTSPTSITFLVNSSAQQMAPGTYGPAAILFTNTTNGQGSATRNATIKIDPIPTLQVSSASDIAVSGNVGGTFSPNSFSYTLSTNTGSVQYEILYVPSWLTASSTSGTATTAGTTVTFTVNDSAKSLPAGGYTATILFSNVTEYFNGRGSQTRFAALRVIATGTGPSFQGLGFLPGDQYGMPFGVSSDGKVATGLASQRITNDSGQRAFRWDQANGMVSLGVLPGGINSFGQGNSEGFGVTSDGSVIVGDSSWNGSGNNKSFRWQNGTMTGLPYLLPEDTSSSARAVNSDGTVVVGWSFGTQTRAVRWVNGSVSGLGFLPGHDISLAYGVNPQGTAIVGFSCSSTQGCHTSSGSQAFLWTNGTMTSLGGVPGGRDSSGTAVNADGTVVVGYYTDSASNTRAFRWTAAGGMKDLGISAGSSSSSDAVNADGSVIVGYSNSAGHGAFRWSAADGVRSIEELLTAVGIDFTGWSLNRATGVSADGTVMVGFGSDPSGHQQGWIARLPLASAGLQVSSTSDISTLGNQGGPFAPSTFSYQLSASSGSIDYTITNIPSWLDASSTSGTVTTTATTITFTVNASASSLSPGTYSSLPIVFTNTASGQGNTTRAATLTVNAAAPGSLQLTPSTSVSASGVQGGPFSPSSFSYTLNSASGSIGYSISGLPAWLTASSTSGTLTTSPTTITFTVNASANNLLVGTHGATISFTNTSNGQGSQTISAALSVVSGGGGSLLTRTWVSGGGDDGNACSRTAPCKTFAAAISVTATEGEINCLDPGGYGTLTITKSITIDCTGTFGSILSSGTIGITIDLSTSPDTLKSVVLRGLRINGTGGGAQSGLKGVSILSAAAVTLENMVIMNHSQQGIVDLRTAPGKLFIKNSVIRNNAGVGICICGTNTTSIENVHSINNLYGLATAVGNNVRIAKSVFSGNSAGGIEADSGAQVGVEHSTMNFNGTGLEGYGAVWLSDTDISFNRTGIIGQATSFGDNKIYGNGSAGTAPTVGAASIDHGQQ